MPRNGLSNFVARTSPAFSVFDFANRYKKRAWQKAFKSTAKVMNTQRFSLDIQIVTSVFC
jgi:hypothetical protein